LGCRNCRNFGDLATNPNFTQVGGIAVGNSRSTKYTLRFAFAQNTSFFVLAHAHHNLHRMTGIMAKKATKKKASKAAKAKKATTKKKAAKKKAADEGDDAEAPKKKKKKPAKKRKSRAAAAAEVRLRIFWGVFNHQMKRVALYEFNQRKAAEKKAKELSPEGKPPHFVQKVKEEVIDEPEVEEGEEAPKKKKATKKAATKKATKKKATKKKKS
jgi:hypothetical protein